jgi:hypothetical protein
MFMSKDIPNSVCILMPYSYRHPMMTFIRRGRGGYLWQTIQVAAMDDEEAFYAYCIEYFGLFDRDEQDILQDNVKSFLHAQG